MDFDTEVMAKERLMLPARMKGGGIKRTTDAMYPTFLGALLYLTKVCGQEGNQRGDIEGNILGAAHGGDWGGSIQ